MLFVLEMRAFCKHCHVNRLDLLVSWHLVILIDKQATKSKFLRQGLRVCVNENTCEEIVVFVVWGNRFFVGNSRLNCQIIESIFDMSLVYLSLHVLVHWLMSFIAVHVTQICCFEFRYLEFSFGFLKNALLQILLSWIFEKDRVFFTLNFTKHPLKIQRLFVENSREQRTNFNELRLHYFCTIL